MITELIERIGGRDRLAKLVAQYDEEGYCDVQDDEVIAALRALLEVLDAKPNYYIHRVEVCDSYGPEVDLRAFVSELDASKCKDDHGGEVTEVFTTPPAASEPVSKGYTLPDVACDSAMPKSEATVITHFAAPHGYKLVPIEPTWGMLSADGCSKHHDGQECSHHENRKRIWSAMLAAAPAPGGDGE